MCTTVTGAPRAPARLLLQLALLLLLAPWAHARSSPPPPTAGDKPAAVRRTKPRPAVIAEARRRFLRGNAHYRRGNYSEALLAYQAALDLYEEPVILYNLAQTYEKLRAPGQAALMFERYLRLRPKARDREAVQRRIAKLRSEARAEVSVTSYPPGAAIYVGKRSDGVKGRTPFVLKLPLGKQSLIVDLRGFVAERRQVTVRLGQRNLVDVQLQRKTSIRVDADVPGARTYIDGSVAGERHRTPHLFEVEPGKHQIHVVLAGYHPVRRSVELEAGDQISLLVNLKPLPQFGRLQVMGARGATLLVEGRERATLPMQPLKLPAGSYRITLSRDGHRPWESKVNVTPDRLTRARVTLSPLRSTATKAVLYSSVGATVGAAIAGTVYGVLAMRSEREYNALPKRSTFDQGKSQALRADAFFAAAGAAALAGIVTYVATMRGPSSADVTIAPLAGEQRPAGEEP